jgi:hypothetical protein
VVTMKNFGKLHYAEIRTDPIYMFQTQEQEDAGEPKVMMMPPRKFMKQFMDDGSAWWDTAKDLPDEPGIWYIAVNDDGYIMMAEREASMISLDNCDVWQIKHSGPDTDIRGHKWTGKKVEPWDAS